MKQVSIYFHDSDERLVPVLHRRARTNNRSLSAEVVALVKLGLAAQEMTAEPYNYTVEFWEEE